MGGDPNLSAFSSFSFFGAGWQAPVMAGAEVHQDLFPESVLPTGTTVINDRCLLRTEQDFRIVLVSGIVLPQYAADDRMAEAYAIVSLVQQGWADQKEVARSFKYSVHSVRRLCSAIISARSRC